MGETQWSSYKPTLQYFGISKLVHSSTLWWQVLCLQLKGGCICLYSPGKLVVFCVVSNYHPPTSIDCGGFVIFSDPKWLSKPIHMVLNWCDTVAKTSPTQTTSPNNLYSCLFHWIIWCICIDFSPLWYMSVVSLPHTYSVLSPTDIHGIIGTYAYFLLHLVILDVYVCDVYAVCMFVHHWQHVLLVPYGELTDAPQAFSLKHCAFIDDNMSCFI